MGPGTIILSQHVDGGVAGEDSDPVNPLARATRALLHDGAGFRSAASVHFADPITRALRWFGLFVEGDSGRLVFFPGFAKRPDRLGYQRDGHPSREIPHLADHVTLEPDRARWHSTEYAGRSSRKRRAGGGHQGGAWTRPIGEGRVLWFGMSISGAEMLRVVRAGTVALAPAPPNSEEVERRMEVFRQAIADTVGVLVVPGSLPAGPSALHFSVVVAPVGAPDYTGRERGLGRSGAGFRLLAQDGTTTPYNSMTIPLGTAIRLQLFVMWVPAEMTAAIVLHAADETRSPSFREFGPGS